MPVELTTADWAALAVVIASRVPVLPPAELLLAAAVALECLAIRRDPMMDRK